MVWYILDEWKSIEFPIEPGTQRLVMWSCFVPVGSSCRACHRASGKSRTRRLSRKSDLEVSDNLSTQKRPRENASKNVNKNKTEQGGLLFKAIQSVIPITWKSAKVLQIKQRELTPSPTCKELPKESWCPSSRLVRFKTSLCSNQ